MANLKDLMRLSPQELIGMGAQYGLTFNAGMKKSFMASQLAQSAASGWMDVNAGLISGVAEDDGISYGDSSMISDAAHLAQMISGAGYTETFHAAMNGPSHHVEAVHSYMNSLGVSADDVLMHMPKSNPNLPTGHFGMLNAYMRDTLSGHQDIMPELAGHYSGDIMGEYATNQGGIKASYEHLAHMYVDKSQYNNSHLYDADVSRVASRLASSMGPAFSEVAYSAANGAHVSYMSALPHLGDPSVVGGVVHPRAALNASGLPMGAIGSGINNEYSLSASLTGTPGWSPASKEVYSNIASTVKSLAGVYRGESGMEGSRHITSERDMIMDSASRYVDVMDARSGYANLSRDLADEPSYSATNIRAIIDNSYDQMDAVAQAAAPGVSNPGLRMPTAAQTGSAFTANFDEPTSWNSARARRESIAIANMDSIPWRDIESENNPVRMHNLEQGSQEWLDFRKNYDITGSTVGGFLGNNAYTRPWAEMVDKIGLSRSKGTNAFQEKMFAAGHKTEDEARIRVAKQLGTDIQQTGAITNDNYPSFMYSPDGLIGDDAIWEHKNPERAGKFANLLAGDHPDYMDQVQFGMLVSGRSRALFSQTIGNQTQSQWIDRDEGWYDRNRSRLDSTLGRLDAGRAFVRDNSDLPPDELISGARRAMMGEGIWKDVSQKSNRGYSASAGTGDDPFASSRSSFNEGGNGYVPNFTMPPQNFPVSMGGGSDTGTDLMAQSVKRGILAAQEENKQRSGATGASGIQEDADFDDLGNPRGWSRSRIDDAFGGGGGSGRGGGGRGGSGGGSFYDDFGRAGGALAYGIAGGSLSSLSGGAMQALMATPWGRVAGLGIGAIQIGNEAAEGLNDFVGNSLDAGESNPIAYSSMSQGMEMLGLNSQQAGRINQTTHSAFNTLLNGDPSGAVRIVQGTRGLITIGDIRAAEGDPVALARVMQQRGRERGWSQARIAGAMQMAGLDGMARAYDRTEYTQGQAESVVQAGRNAEYADGTTNLENLQSERARLLPSYNVPQTAIQYGGSAFGAMSDAAGNVRIMGTSSMDAIHQFISGAESGNNPLARSSTSSAYGSMQTLDGTRRDPGFGVRPAQDNSPEEAARVGRDYYDAMYNRYQDHDKAMAAYTDGPGTVDAAIKNHGADWLSVMPAQAKNRVAAFHKWQQDSGSFSEGASGFTRNGLSYGQTAPVNINVNIDAKVNNQTASASVSATGGQSVTQQMNIGNGAMQRR